jgi:hypothetical protein
VAFVPWLPPIFQADRTGIARDRLVPVVFPPPSRLPDDPDRHRLLDDLGRTC